MDITLHPNNVSTREEGLGHFLHATESKSRTTISLVLTPELTKKLAPLWEEEKKKIADEAFEKGGRIRAFLSSHFGTPGT